MRVEISPRTEPKESSVANVLQKPFRRNLPAEAGALRQLVDFAGDGVKLRALQIAAFRIGDLVRRGAPLHFARDDVCECDAPIRQGVAVLAAPVTAVAVLGLLRARLITEMLGIGGELGMSDRRRCIAKPQVNVYPLKALGVRLAAAPTTTMWVPFSSRAPSVTSTAESVRAATM